MDIRHLGDDRSWRRIVTRATAALALAVTTAIVTGGVVVAADARSADADLDRALIEAAWRNDIGAACELIADGADVNAKDATVQSAYLVSTSEGYLELLELTLANGADVASLDRYRGTGLIRSAERGHWPVVGRLLRAGIDVDHINRLGWTALHEAIILGDGSQDYIDTVRLLVAGGADVELATGRGEHPLDLAIGEGQDAIAASLGRVLEAERIADPDEVLFGAIAAGDADGAALALRAGASLAMTNANGQLPAEVAAQLGQDDIARLIEALVPVRRVDVCDRANRSVDP